MIESLVIGYGNSLRSDDGIGLEVARIVADWGLPQVRSLALPQLTPELAAELALVDLVVFVDAYAADVRDRIEILTLEPSGSIGIRSHFSDPRALLSLTQELFGKRPSAWHVLVPGVNFQLGDRLSASARQGSERASKIVKSLLSVKT